ncbi:MAG: hypothetical protein KKB31_00440, partial [Nanoarchaeota archaeon]|nr:hypothetical protein [Nanoarchaeota archaeon]
FNFLIFAVAVPIIETYVIFCVGIDVLASIFKIPTDRRSLFNPKTMVLIIAISIAFLFFHISAKGLENESALILVGIMAFISCILILGFQEFRVAILLHLEANIIASISFFSSVAEKTISNVFVPLINLMPLG